MITLQHSLCYLLTKNGDIEKFKQGIAYCLLPDGIRAYIGARPYSHFEENPTQTDVSWYRFPNDLKNLTKEKANIQDRHLADIQMKSCLGETSQVSKFVETNQHLSNDYYEGVLIHLIQDYIFDEWIRETIDCSNKYEPNAVFGFQGNQYNSLEIRQVIGDLEQYGFYLLAYICFEKYGIVANQEWFDKNVFEVLKDIYPLDLANSTYKYMKIPDSINEKITNKDWSGLKFPKYNAEYSELYGNVITYTQDTDLFFSEIYNNKNKKSLI